MRVPPQIAGEGGVCGADGFTFIGTVAVEEFSFTDFCFLQSRWLNMRGK
jgi:hypothetical protein